MAPERRFDFPAVVPAAVSVRPGELNTTRRGRVTATIELARPEDGFSLDDVDFDTVSLTPLGSIAPPVDEGVSATAVRTVGDRDHPRLRARFPAEKVTAALGSGEREILVSGRGETRARRRRGRRRGNDEGGRAGAGDTDDERQVGQTVAFAGSASVDIGEGDGSEEDLGGGPGQSDERRPRDERADGRATDGLWSLLSEFRRFFYRF